MVCIGNAGRMLHSDPSLLRVHFKHRLLLRFVWLSDTLGSASSAAGSPPPGLWSCASSPAAHGEAQG